MKVTRAVGSYFVGRPLSLTLEWEVKNAIVVSPRTSICTSSRCLAKIWSRCSGEGRKIALNGNPAVDWFFLLLGDIDQWIMLAVPDGCELLWVEMEKSLAIAFNQNRDRALRFHFVGLCRHHFPFPCGHKCSHIHICFRDFSPRTSVIFDLSCFVIGWRVCFVIQGGHIRDLQLVIKRRVRYPRNRRKEVLEKRRIYGLGWSHLNLRKWILLSGDHSVNYRRGLGLDSCLRRNPDPWRML